MRWHSKEGRPCSPTALIALRRACGVSRVAGNLVAPATCRPVVGRRSYSNVDDAISFCAAGTSHPFNALPSVLSGPARFRGLGDARAHPAHALRRRRFSPLFQPSESARFFVVRLASKNVCRNKDVLRESRALGAAIFLLGEVVIIQCVHRSRAQTLLLIPDCSPLFFEFGLQGTRRECQIKRLYISFIKSAAAFRRSLLPGG